MTMFMANETIKRSCLSMSNIADEIIKATDTCQKTIP